jgi:hypothetical protein
MNTYPSITEDMTRGNANYYDSPSSHFHPLVILLPRRCSLLAAARMVLVAPALKLLPKVTSFSVFP